MTPAEILAITKPWAEVPFERHGQIHLPLLGRVVPLQVYGPDEDQSEDGNLPPITDGMAEALTAFLALGPSHLPELRAIMAGACMEFGGWAVKSPRVPQNSLSEWATAYGLSEDGRAPEDWPVDRWDVGDLDLRFDERSPICYLTVLPPWDTEHGSEIALVRGRLRAIA